MLEAELEAELGYSKGDKKNKNTDNRRNGTTPKIVKTKFREIKLDIPKDRKGKFKPIVVPKHTRDISGIEEQIISLYARSMTTRDIHDQINEWKNRPLEPIYPFIFLDALHYKVREDGQIKNKAAYIVLGITFGRIQRCIIHQFRNSFKYVNHWDLKQFTNDFKAVNEEIGYQNLLELEEKWGKKYPYAIKSWDMN